ncbi:adenylosuccinate lyase [Patescibacteria group bacterium]
MNTLQSISPIDGKYRRYTQPLAEFFSEKGLICKRLFIECEFLIFLSEYKKFGIRSFSKKEKDIIRRIYKVNDKDLQIIKDIEVKGYKNIGPTFHDVKSIEYFIVEKLKKSTLKDSLNWIHFGLTTADINNIAYYLMISDGIDKILYPVLKKIYSSIEKFAQKYKDIPMLARTHGQVASPTTVGKEFKVFSHRLKSQMKQLKGSVISAKLNGATGNYNALYAAYPKINWFKFTERFIKRLNTKRIIKLEADFVTTQIENRDNLASLFDCFRRINTILIDFVQDIWRYISDDWIKQKVVKEEVGSSTMPHKVNPINFENAEGNLGIANSLFSFFSSKVPISRLQRDLSGSTVRRNYGVAFGHSLVAYKSILKGLDKIEINKEKIIQELKNHPEVISEAIQTILRRENVEKPYEKLKELTRGKKITKNIIDNFIDQLDISPEVKNELRKISPENYTGLASEIVTKF